MQLLTKNQNLLFAVICVCGFFCPTDSADLGLIEPIPEYIPHGECENNNKWHTVQIGERTYRIDMESIDQYKRVLSHGGKISLVIIQSVMFDA